MTAKPVLIIGGRSDIGLATAHRFAAAGRPIQLAARRVETLAKAQADLRHRHNVEVTLHELDVLAAESFADFIAGLPRAPGVAVCVAGLLGEQEKAQSDLEAASLILRSNFEGPALLLGLLAESFEKRGSGVLIGVSSVAGDRGRASNYVYGSAKAGFTAFLSGLRNRLAKKGVHVATILPGFVATRMTEGMDLPPRLTAQPEQVAEAIFKAASARRNVVYVKAVWRPIMFVIRSLPEGLFKRTRI